MLGTSYQIDAGGATLLQPVTLTFPYDPLLIPAGQDASSLTMAYYDGVTWTQLVGTVDLVAHTVSVTTSHFSVWAVVVKAPATHPPFVAHAPAGVNGFFINPLVQRGQPLCASPSKALSSSRWQLFNVAGELVGELSADGSSVCMETRRLASGLYLLRAQSQFADGTSSTDIKKIVLRP